MKKNKLSIAIKMMLALTFASILLMLVTPSLLFVYTHGTYSIMGWTAVFGGQFKVVLENGSVWTNATSNFNWQLYITLLVLLVNGLCAYIIGPKGRGYYVFSAIVFAGCALMFFTSKIWLNSTFGITSIATIANYEHLGVGPWCAGIFSLVAAVACVAEFVNSKNVKSTSKSKK